jgi:MoaA/NifB/PqqE/SkfB family radical SAM enzyme
MQSVLGIRYQVRYHRCNLKCPYCIAHWDEQKNLFSPANFSAIIGAIKKLPFRIRLRLGIGGEVFTSPKLMEGIKSICNSDSNILNVSFSTNLAADWDGVIRPFLASVDTSKLGVGCTLHDMVIRDIDGFFRKADALKAAGAEIYVGNVAVPGRFKHLGKYKKRCADLGAPLILNGLVGSFVGWGNAGIGKNYPGDYTMSELSELKELWDTPHGYLLLAESRRTEGMACSAGRNYVYIDHQGNVFPCQHIRRSMGNILAETVAFQNQYTVCPEKVCWCGNENQALRIVDRYYDRSKTLRIFTPKAGLSTAELYQGYNPPVFDRREEG